MNPKPLRGTQSAVGQLAWVIKRPSLTGLEIAWRWAFGAPLLYVCYLQTLKIFAAVPPETAGLDSLDIANPWLSAVKIGAAWTMYQPSVVHVLRWLGPIAAVAWIVFSAVGRNLVLKRMEPRLAFRPLAMIALQTAWLGVLVLTLWGWWTCINWAAARDVGNGSNPDLVAYFGWVIFLSIAFFGIWALVSWAVTMAPMLMLLECRSIASAVRQSVRLGKPFTSKLVEINLVMGIVTLSLVVLAMVFSSVLLPFTDEIGISALHVDWMVVSVCYLIASDYFQVVRLKQFVEFWRVFRGQEKSA